MPATLEQPTAAPAAPVLAPTAAEQGHYESLYGGLDKLDSQLGPEQREQLTTLTEGEDDPQEARARMVNVAYIKAKNPQIDEDALTQNWEAAKSAYAKQLLGVDKPSVTDKELYAGIAGKMQKDRDERTILGEGMGKLFDSFRQGGTDWRQAFTSTLADMKGKPGYDPARLDVYRHMAENQWNHWEASGQHYPEVVKALTDYFKMEKVPVQPNEYQEDATPLIERGDARQAALHALSSVPPEQQDALIGLAMRGKGEAAPDDFFGNKMANRAAQGIGEFATSAVRSFRDMAGMASGLGLNLAGQYGRKAERKLDAAVAGGVDPYHGSNWFSEGVLGATEGVPRMLAMFHPAGIAANVMAFSEEARGHFEDAGMDPAKAQGLGLVASIPLTALQLVTSKTVVGGGAVKAGEAWMLNNIAGKSGVELAKGYAKNMLLQTAENTAVLSLSTAGQQLTEPAVQSLANLMDGTIPGVKWSGKDGELARLAGATPHTLATLVPLIALGTGVATLRSRGAALEARTVQDRPSLEAVGMPPAAVEEIMAAPTAEEAVASLQQHFPERVPNPVAVEALNAYHGTPHEVTAFDESKIGTGEGNQTYGHGLYFAEHPDTAKSYAETLAKEYVTVDGKRVMEMGDTDNPDHWALTTVSMQGLERTLKQVDTMVEDGTLSDKAGAQLRAAAEKLRGKEVGRESAGNVYKVQLNVADHQMLDWDKPLSEQSATVQAALEPLRQEYRDSEGQRGPYIAPHATGEQIYKELRQMEINRLAAEDGASPMAAHPDKYREKAEKAASAQLAKLGIHGIKYLDQVSRDKGDGTHNFVIFNGKHAEIVEKNGQPTVNLAADGGYTVKDGEGQPAAQTATPEMAAKAVEDLRSESSAHSGELFDTGESFNLASEEQRAPSAPVVPEARTLEMFGTDQTRSYAATKMDKARMRSEAMAHQDAPGVALLDWIKGKLPRPEDARLLQGELRGIYENLSKDVNVGRAARGKKATDQPRSAYTATNTSAANAFFAKKGEQGDLDRLRQAANEAGFNFETPADMLAAVEEAMRGKKIFGNAKEDVQTLGFVAGGGRIGDIINHGIAGARQFAREVTQLPEFKGFHEVLNKWVGDTQLGIMHTTADVKKVIAAVPEGITRRAIGRWIDAGGDRAALQGFHDDATMESAKKEYAAALKLTPEQVRIAESIQAWFKQRFERATEAGVMDEKNFRQNYMTQIIDRPFVQGGDNSKFGNQLNKNFKFSQERTFPNFAELEKAGFSAKTTDVAEIMARYDTALNKAIMSRQLVKDLLEAKNEAGEPLAVPLKGSVREGEGAEPNFINNPRQQLVDQAQDKIDGLMKQIADLHEQLESGKGQSRFDIADEIRDLRAEVKELRSEQNPEDAKLYKSIDHPALRKYWWMGKDKATGKETFIEGDIGLHPAIKGHLENALGTSGLRRWWDSDGNMMNAVPKGIVKLVDLSNGFLKRNLLGGLSLFHAVHEYKRALGNRVVANPFTHLEIDPKDPNVQMQVRSGLMLATPHDVTNLYDHSAGLGGAGSLIDHVPVIGKISKGVSEYTFSKLIPKLKSDVWNHVYARNLETFKDAIGRGEATKEQVAYLTSNQINARFGHQNLADIGRNPTFQHILQIGTLAPDFWESNARNYGQDIQGLIGAKNGREPAIALATTAAVLWLTSRVLNKALDDDWHFDQPFAVVHDGRVWTMRNEVEDLVRLWGNARGYVMGRLSPTGQAFEEWRSGTNWRGEKITTAEVFKNWIAKVFPMSLRFLPGVKDATDKLETGGGRTISVWQQFLGSIGVQVGRYSALNDAYKLANDWRKKQGDKEDRGTYPVSKYQQLRYALEDKDEAKAIEEMAKLRKPGEPLYKLARGFEASVLHSWTGSREKDSEFMDSLTPEQKATVEKANAHRQMVLERFRAILQSTDSSTTNP